MNEVLGYVNHSWRQEKINQLKQNFYDLVIIGGGINGVGVARDAALRGLKVAVIEKKDFASGTSSKSSKLVHGGLRYLQYYEFKLVREATTERKTLLKLAPHIVKRLPFIVPIYKWTPLNKFKLRMGLTLYDLLSFPKGIGRHKMLNRKKIEELEPILSSPQLKGGGFYYDCFMDDARLLLENVLDADRLGADLLSYAEVIDFLVDETTDKIMGVKVRDTFTKEEFEVRGKIVLNTAGPWADKIRALKGNYEKRLRTTKGIHLIMPRIVEKHAFALFLDDGRVVFVIPYHEFTLIGTTDTDYTDDLDNIPVTKEDVEYLLSKISEHIPNLELKREEILAGFAGLRPLVREEGKEEGAVSREHKIYMDEDGLITLIGGKWTTYRTMAKELVDRVVEQLGFKRKEKPCITDKIPLPGGQSENFEEYYKNKFSEYVQQGLSEHVANHLIHTYGTRSKFVVETIFESEENKELLVEGLPFTVGEIKFIARNEFVFTLSDVMWRRTRLGFSPQSGIPAMDKVAEVLATELGWDKQFVEEQKEKYLEEVKLVNYNLRT